MSDFTQRVTHLEDPSLAPDKIAKMHLLEASAGTGKTFSIQTLYLRLVLIEGLSVQQILTVTFSKEATKELRERLQRIVRDALEYLENNNPEVEDRTRWIVDLARTTETIGSAKTRDRLRLALLDFDMASIYTIHGFCQRVLKGFAFETHQRFDIEPINNADEEIERLCKDWWRKTTYEMDPNIADFLAEDGAFSLSAITNLAKTIIAKPDAIIDVPHHASIATAVKSQLQEFNKHPIAPEEKLDYADACEAIRTIICDLQKRIRTFRAKADATPEAALTLLSELCRYETIRPTHLEDHAMLVKQACEQFMALVPKRTLASKFLFDAQGCLVLNGCPDVEPRHTEAIKQAIHPLASLDTISRGFEPFSIKKNGSFESYLLLAKHFYKATESSADEVYKAIKTIASTGCGIARQVRCSVDALNSHFRDFHRNLTNQASVAIGQAAAEIKASYRESRPLSRTASFDDYLMNLRDALGKNNELVEVLRDQFRAALIDEFQDTDPIQWGIFEKLFKDVAIPCFLVGDPKQAIYRFRNGDIETYLQATSEHNVSRDTRYPLTKNFRSEQRLIDAVNQIFLDQQGEPTFGAKIHYAMPLSAAGKPLNDCLLIDQVPDNQPFKLLLLDNQPGSRVPGKTSQTAKLAYKITAQEIAMILCDPTQTIAGKRIQPEDITVLVYRHAEAHAIAEELKQHNIPSVRQGTGNVWLTEEGYNLWTALEAILEARNPNNLRLLLLSPWGGLSYQQILCLNDGESILPPYSQERPYALDSFVATLIDLKETWQQRGYASMFRKLMTFFDLKERLLKQPDGQGQRRLANISHLSERIERSIDEEQKNPEALLAWIRRQLSADTADGGEEVQMRLETDDNAVNIMTIFASKGLEFPIVFVPTLFMMSPNKQGKTYEYHDEDGRLHIVQKTGSDSNKDVHKLCERSEIEQEFVRQMYVALTRAVHRTVIMALYRVGKDGKTKKNGAQTYKQPGVLGKLLRLPLISDGDTGIVDIQQARHRFENIASTPCAIDIRLVSDDPERLTLAGPSVAIMPTPLKPPHIDTSRGHGSFSSIVPHMHTNDIISKFSSSQQEDSKDNDQATSHVSETAYGETLKGIFAFPAGARTGTCWHEIFEELEFTQSGDGAITKLVEQKLALYGFLKRHDQQQTYLDVTVSMVRNVLQTKLPKPSGSTEGESFSFSEISNEHRKNEWAFSFPTLCGKRSKAIIQTVEAFPRYQMFTKAIEKWDTPIPGGYMTGFVDLLFRQGQRYFIADWKSNRRGGTQADFQQQGLDEEMTLHHYWLQYLIYAVAVHQYLSKTLTGYQYEQHFGGIYYVFLRGVDGKHQDGHTNGIYCDLPPKELIVRLSSVLGDFT